MNTDKKVTMIYFILGILVGAASFYINSTNIAPVLMITVFYISYVALKKIMKINEKFKWFFSNGGWIYVFIWFIVWAILINTPYVIR